MSTFIQRLLGGADVLDNPHLREREAERVVSEAFQPKNLVEERPKIIGASLKKFADDAQRSLTALLKTREMIDAEVTRVTAELEAELTRLKLARADTEIAIKAESARYDIYSNAELTRDIGKVVAGEFHDMTTAPPPEVREAEYARERAREQNEKRAAALKAEGMVVTRSYLPTPRANPEKITAKRPGGGGYADGE